MITSCGVRRLPGPTSPSNETSTRSLRWTSLTIPTFSDLDHNKKITMSLASKAFFGFSMLFTGGTIWVVHYMQQQESEVS